VVFALSFSGLKTRLRLVQLTAGVEWCDLPEQNATTDAPFQRIPKQKHAMGGTALRNIEARALSAACALVFVLVPGESKQNNTRPAVAVPPGTILPVRLNTSLNTEKSKPGGVITGRTMQEVPLPGDWKIPAGSKVFGELTAVTPAKKGGSEISFRFDSIAFRHQRIALLTSLRAVAGFVEVEQAHIPIMSSGEGEVYDWLPTVQIGGEDVYGVGGPVTRWNDPSEVVGTETPDGLLGQVHARDGTPCQGPLYGNEARQALWVFSSDACGTYGLANLTIAHAGRTNPVGVIVLRAVSGKLNLPSGTGMLLRVRRPENQ